ncbi:solute carrier family 35 member G1-like [Oratosquilla oratoria]|uniref:solute carrier family 35 member G1-like n=1 Tax=Oratosquilla oratoria TaxID=337810 RepID=UPI003F761A8E
MTRLSFQAPSRMRPSFGSASFRGSSRDIGIELEPLVPYEESREGINFRPGAASAGRRGSGSLGGGGGPLEGLTDCGSLESEGEDIRRRTEPPKTSNPPCSFPHVGLFMAVMSSFFFSLCSLIVKLLSDINPMNLALYRFVGILLPTLPILVHRQIEVFPRGSRLMLIFRGIVGTISLMMQFYAFRHMPLADASTIVFSVPVFVALFARIFLKEPVGLFNVVVILMTILGVTLIARPPMIMGSLSDAYTKENWWGVVAAMCGVIVGANVYVILRTLKHLHFSVIMTNFAFVALILTPIVSWFTGGTCVPICGPERYLIVVLGAFSFGGQILLTKALQVEQAGPVSIARTADVVFAFIWQVLVFQKVPDILSISGALLVTSSVFLTGLRKWVQSQQDSKMSRRLRCLTC